MARGKDTAARPSGTWRARLRRVHSRLSLRNRLVLSHVTVLVVTLGATAVAKILVRGPWNHRVDPDNIGFWTGVAAAVLAAVVLSRFLVRPLDTIRAATRRLAEGRYDTVLELPSEPGFAALVEDVNTLAAALADTERRRARLVSEIAHEMRTPITILHGQIEGMADGIFTPDDAMFASLSDDLDRLRRLASDLSSLSRVEEEPSPCTTRTRTSPRWPGPRRSGCALSTTAVGCTSPPWRTHRSSPSAIPTGSPRSW